MASAAIRIAIPESRICQSGDGEQRGQLAGEEAEGEEPVERGGDGAQAVDPAAVGAALVGEGAEQDDGVEVDVRVEVGEPEAGQRTLRRAAGAWSAGLIAPGFRARRKAKAAYT